LLLISDRLSGPTLQHTSMHPFSFAILLWQSLTKIVNSILSNLTK